MTRAELEILMNIDHRLTVVEGCMAGILGQQREFLERLAASDATQRLHAEHALKLVDHIRRLIEAKDTLLKAIGVNAVREHLITEKEAPLVASLRVFR